MTSSTLLTINGFTFHALCNARGESGIIINRVIEDEAELCALNLLLSSFTVIDKFYTIVEESWYYLSDPTQPGRLRVLQEWDQIKNDPMVCYLCTPDFLEAIAKLKSAPSIKPRPTKLPTPGYVYLLQSERGYKIGKSKSPGKRVETLGVVLPFPIDTVALIKTPNMGQLELELHNHFADKRINGEWFALTPEDVEYIKALETIS